MKALLPLFSLLIPACAAAGEGRWRFRAREHFEASSIRLAAGAPSESHFTPFSAVSFVREVEHASQWGVRLGFGSPKAKRAALPGASDRPGLLDFGFEAKRYFKALPAAFWRLSVLAARVDPRATAGKRFGAGAQAELGWEFPIKKVGLAFSAGYKHLFLESGGRYSAFTPAVGLHFYL